jgi:hypothetical protein
MTGTEDDHKSVEAAWNKNDKSREELGRSRVEVGKRLFALKQEVVAGGADWASFFKANFKRTTSDARKLLKIGGDPNPEEAWKKANAARRATGRKKKTEPVADTGAGRREAPTENNLHVLHPHDPALLPRNVPITDLARSIGAQHMPPGAPTGEHPIPENLMGEPNPEDDFEVDDTVTDVPTIKRCFANSTKVLERTASNQGWLRDHLSILSPDERENYKQANINLAHALDQTIAAIDELAAKPH